MRLRRRSSETSIMSPTSRLADGARHLQDSRRFAPLRRQRAERSLAAILSEHWYARRPASALTIRGHYHAAGCDLPMRVVNVAPSSGLEFPARDPSSATAP